VRRAVLPLLTLAAAAFPASDRAALNLAIAGTRNAPPDLARLIVQFRKEYLTGVREEIRRAPAANFSLEAQSLSHAILERTPMSEVIHRCGRMVGELLASETPKFDKPEDLASFEEACAGPYQFAGVSAGAAAGNPTAVAASIAKARDEFATTRPPAARIASRIVTDETNLLWAIWMGAGGDVRPAKNFEERNGPYTIPGVPR
jgi:hypothetical protein